MGIIPKELLLKLIQDFGLYRLMIDTGTKAINDLIDKDPGLEKFTDSLANGSTLPEAIREYVKSTPNVKDDEIEVEVTKWMKNIREALESIETKPFLELIYGIKLKNGTLGDVKLPDFTKNDDTDNYTIKKVTQAILS